MDLHSTKEELKCFGIHNGEPYVMMVGMRVMLEWFADNCTTSQRRFKLKVGSYIKKS